MRRAGTFVFFSLLAMAGAARAAEPLTLREAVSRALQNSPDIRAALAQQEKAQQTWREARAQFIPAVTAGSGLAGTYGFPMSIEGSAPAAFQVVSSSMLFNRPQHQAVAEAQKMWRATEAGGESRAQEVAWKTAAAYLGLNKAQHSLDPARHELESAQRIEEAVAAQVGEGRAMPLEAIKARLATARQRQAVTQIEGQIETLQATLRGLLGLAPDQQIDAVDSSLPPNARELAAKPVEAALSRATEQHSEIRRLGLEVEARQARVRAEKLQRWPQLDLVGQYAVLAKINNYQDFFQRFARHNAELGFSARLPIFDGNRIKARVAQAEADVLEAKAALQSARNNIAVEVRRLYQEVKQLEGAQEVAKLELEVAREALNVALARFQEGRLSTQALESARTEESGRWLAFLDSNFALERARLDVLRQTGDLSAALR